MALPKGKSKRLIVGMLILFILFGIMILLTGLYALIFHQPYAMWYPFVISGFVFCVVMGGLLGIVLKLYREAEKRKH